jgi:SAM-dependent methyltransferase
MHGEHEVADNIGLNREHFEELYSEADLDVLGRRARDHKAFLADAMVTDTSWHGLYGDGFAERLAGTRVLELGSGDGLNAVLMAALGAEVVAVDLIDVLPGLVRELEARSDATRPVEVLVGELPDLHLAAGSFDLVVGKSFLHHLTQADEDRYLREIARLLRPGGEARFAEPAVNSARLDALRWMIPVSGRPSRLSRDRFAAWKAADPHPERDNSSPHYRRVGARYFADVRVEPFGGIERLHRLLPAGNLDRRFRRVALRIDEAMPQRVREAVARAQRIVYANPRLQPDGLGVPSPS